MTNRKGKRRTPIDIRKDILDYLKKADFTRTTGQIGKAVGLNWYTADYHLRLLKVEGTVFHQKVDRNNEWCLMEKYEYGFKRFGIRLVSLYPKDMHSLHRVFVRKMKKALYS